MNKKVILIFLSLVLINKLNSQSIFPKEKMFINTNTSLLFTGETLYFKIYNLTSNNNLSNVSKIAYVELIGSNRKNIFKKKISLTKGHGQADYFLPTTIPTGNYKIIGYTNLMLNNNTFFIDDLYIINPYLIPDNKKIEENTVAKIDFENQNSDIKNSSIDFEISNKLVNNREKVSIILKSNLNSNISGNLSLSVRKVDSTLVFPKKNFNNIKNVTFDEECFDKKELLPELRGEVVSGHITSNNENMPIANLNVFLTILGNNNLFKATSTNKNGQFYFLIDEKYNSDNAVLQVYSQNRDDYNILLDTNFKLKYDCLTFNKKIQLDSIYESEILKRSINNQIENAYSYTKQDSLISNTSNELFYGKDNNKLVVYNLDDYNRFKTIKETFVEIIEDVWINRKGKNNFIVVRPIGIEKTKFLPMILVDGVLIQDHNKIIDIDSRKIKTISVLRGEYLVGNQVFDGILSIESFKNDLLSNILPKEKSVKAIKLFNPELVKQYYNQTHNNDSDTRIPDFREQLLWMPNIEFNGEKETIFFFTSDVDGVYEVVLEGFCNNEPIFLKKTIRVK